MGEKKKFKAIGEEAPAFEGGDSEAVEDLKEIVFSIDDLQVAGYGMERPYGFVEDELNRRIIGQSPAIESTVTSLYRESIRNPNRPMAVLLFLGPTGVGKSEAAKVLDELLHDGKADTLLKIDCSNYSENHRVSALIGAAPEYVGREQKPVFDKKKIEQKRSIILFDEVEKGAPALFNLLLQVLEDGELTLLNGGQKVSFRNSIIILTSNVGSKEIMDALQPHQFGLTGGSNEKPDRKKLESIAFKALENSVFKPEFLNRIDEKIVFEPLTDEQLGEVLDLHVQKANKFYEAQGVRLILTPELRDELIRSTPLEQRRKYGARPILRQYERVVEGTMAKYYTTGGIPKGSEVYATLVDTDGNSAVPIDQKIQLRYRQQKEQVADAPVTPEQTKKRKAEASRTADTNEMHAYIRDKGSLAIGAAAVGIVALFVGDYFSSRKRYRQI